MQQPDMRDLFKDHGGIRFTHKIKRLMPLKDNIIVKNMTFEQRTLKSGIVLLGDNGKTEGIRPRWAQVYAVGPDQSDVAAGQWIMIEHGRWSRALQVEVGDEEFLIQRVDPAAVIFVSDEQPDLDETISTAVMAERKSRD
jgi:co-chaperonin GroES (HSP10)